MAVRPLGAGGGPRVARLTRQTDARPAQGDPRSRSTPAVSTILPATTGTPIRSPVRASHAAGMVGQPATRAAACSQTSASRAARSASAAAATRRTAAPPAIGPQPSVASASGSPR